MHNYYRESAKEPLLLFDVFNNFVQDKSNYASQWHLYIAVANQRKKCLKNNCAKSPPNQFVSFSLIHITPYTN
jgi:hypothetical protein